MNAGQMVWSPQAAVLCFPIPKYELGRLPDYPCKYAKHSPGCRFLIL